MHEPLKQTARHRDTGLGARIGLVVASGLLVGALTSVGQTHLHGPLAALANSAGAWLVAPYFVGARMGTRRGAAAAGLAVCALQLVGYSAVSELRGFSAGGALLVFWAGCAVVGGPVFGLAGHLWSTGPDARRALGAAVLPAAFLAEGTWVYLHELRYYTTAALWLAIAALLAAALMRRPRDARWLAPAALTGLLGEVLLTQLYTQTF